MLRKDARIWWEAVIKSRDVAVMTWAEFLREFNSKYYKQVVINSKVTKFTRLQQRNLSVLEYVPQFDQLSRYTPDMIQTETSKVWRFLSGLRPGLAGLVDTGRDGLESYADAVGRAIRQESWAKTEKGLNLGNGSAQKKVLQPSPFQMVRSQRRGGRFGFQTRRPNNQSKPSRSGGKLQLEGTRKSGLGSQGRPEQLGAGKQAR